MTRERNFDAGSSPKGLGKGLNQVQAGGPKI